MVFFTAAVGEPNVTNVNVHIVVAPLLFLSAMNFFYVFDFLKPVREFLVFIERAVKDLFGFFLVLLAFLVAISLAYFSILRHKHIDDNTANDKYNYLTTLAYVAD